MISTSNSNWLDRLRSSRGFPTGDEPDLDRFLSSSSSGSAPTPNDSTTHSESTQRAPPPPPKQLSGVLSDLFYMGLESSRTFPLKSSRKQPNPRVFRVNNNNGICGGTEVESREDTDLREYTRSEVRIIDTSFKVWRSDKWVFRRNDDWKVKDKRGCKSSAKKKKALVSKLGNSDNNNSVWSHQVSDDNDNLNDDGKVKKMIKKKRKREVDDLLMNQQNKEPSQNDKDREHLKEREDFLSQVPRKRFPCPRPPEKVRKERSSVVLFKCIPPNNVSTAVTPGKTSHKKRPKQMKIS